MLIDTHCHLNILVKTIFDIPLTHAQILAAQHYIDSAAEEKVTTIINVGTNVIESLNCIALAEQYPTVYATVGIHPDDCTENWKQDIQQFKKLLNNKQAAKIVGVGECGIDLYRPGYNLQRQQDAFKAQIELALEYDRALVVHSRNAPEETLAILDTYKKQLARVTLHCFSYSLPIARDVISMGFMLGIDGPVTYKKNDELRTIAQTVPLEHIVLETDAPFLPPQHIRGQQNEPKQIKTIAAFIAELRGISLDVCAEQTTANARALFNLTDIPCK